MDYAMTSESRHNALLFAFKCWASIKFIPPKQSADFLGVTTKVFRKGIRCAAVYFMNGFASADEYERNSRKNWRKARGESKYATKKRRKYLLSKAKIAVGKVK